MSNINVLISAAVLWFIQVHAFILVEFELTVAALVGLFWVIEMGILVMY